MDSVGQQRFADRRAAGTALGELLAAQGPWPGTVVLGLLRGGIPVAARVAARLGAPLGAVAVRKLGLPDEPEVAFGAVARYGRHRVVHHVPAIHDHALRTYSPAALEAVERRAGAALRKLARVFGAFEPECAGRTVVLCDDGLATGATMAAALRVLSRCAPARIIVAVPVAPARVLQELSVRADVVLCYSSPPGFSSVGASYGDFSQVPETEVLRILAEHGGGS